MNNIIIKKTKCSMLGLWQWTVEWIKTRGVSSPIWINITLEIDSNIIIRDKPWNRWRFAGSMPWELRSRRWHLFGSFWQRASWLPDSIVFLPNGLKTSNFLGVRCLCARSRTLLGRFECSTRRSPRPFLLRNILKWFFTRRSILIIVFIRLVLVI